MQPASLLSARLVPAGTVFLALLGASACGKGPPSPPPPAGAPPPLSRALGGEHVAVVGSQTLPKSLVREVALVRKLAPRAALDALVTEALLAEWAVRQQALSDPEVRRRIRASLARRLVAKMRDEALAEGPWTDAELDAAARSSGLWIDVDRPETRTAVHALIRKGTPQQAELAKALRALLLEVPAQGTVDAQAKAFLEKANGLAMPAGHTLVLERLDDPFTADGRIAVKGPPRGLELAFAKAAFAVAVGGTTEIVETSYGVHVIRPLTSEKGLVSPRAARVTALEPELVRLRVGPRYAAKLQALFAATSPEEIGKADDLLLPRVALEPR